MKGDREHEEKKRTQMSASFMSAESMREERPVRMEPKTDSVSRRDFIAVLRMLVRRATWRDRWRARRLKNHWLNDARRALMIEGAPDYYSMLK